MYWNLQNAAPVTVAPIAAAMLMAGLAQAARNTRTGGLVELSDQQMSTVSAGVDTATTVTFTTGLATSAGVGLMFGGFGAFATGAAYVAGFMFGGLITKMMN